MSVKDEKAPQHDSSLPLLAFKKHLGDMYIDPHHLTFVTEVGLGEYALVEHGRVYLTTELRCAEVPCAVKSFRPHVVSGVEDVLTLVNEGRKLKTLQHRNVVKFYGLGSYGTETREEIFSSLFFVEEYVGSWSLKKMLMFKKGHAAQKSNFTIAESMRWMSEAAKGLAYLHKQGIVHADVKCENIYLSDPRFGYTRERIAKIADLKPHKHFKIFAAGEQLQRQLSRQLSRQKSMNTLEHYAAHGVSHPANSSSSSSLHDDVDSVAHSDLDVTIQKVHDQIHEVMACPQITRCNSLTLDDLDQVRARFPALAHQSEQLFRRNSLATRRTSMNDRLARRVLGSNGGGAGSFSQLSVSLSDLAEARGSTGSDSGPKTSQRQRSILKSGSKTLDGADADYWQIPPSGLGRAGSNPNPGSPPSVTGAAHSASMRNASMYSSFAALQFKPPVVKEEEEGELPAVPRNPSNAGRGRSASMDIQNPRLSSVSVHTKVSQPSVDLKTVVEQVEGPVKRVHFDLSVPLHHKEARNLFLMYQAPEVTRGAEPSTKSDVFAFAVVLLQVFRGELLHVDHEEDGDLQAALDRYAHKVANGYREQIPSHWPDEVASLIQRCWAENPGDRPAMEEVGRLLTQYKDDAALLGKLVAIPPEPQGCAAACPIC